MQLNTNIAQAYPYYQTVLLSSALTELDEEILVTIGVYQPIMTKHIAAQLASKNKLSYSRKDINSRLFKTLSNYLVQDEYFRWSLRYEHVEYPSQEEDPEKGQYIDDDEVANLDSTIKIKYSNTKIKFPNTKVKYSNGKKLTIKFKKVNSSKSNGPLAGITYIYYKSPLALALLKKKAGDVCYLPGGLCEVLEVD
jgi:hypothetical protein